MQAAKKIEKYFSLTFLFWQELGETLSEKRFKAAVYTRDQLAYFIPKFLMDESLTELKLHVKVFEGLTREQAKDTIDCIESEILAHSRDNHIGSQTKVKVRPSGKKTPELKIGRDVIDYRSSVVKSKKGALNVQKPSPYQSSPIKQAAKNAIKE